MTVWGEVKGNSENLSLALSENQSQLTRRLSINLDHIRGELKASVQVYSRHRFPFRHNLESSRNPPIKFHLHA